jgi:hypothetical protein
MLEKISGGMLHLDWSPDCASGTTHAVYRGDLEQGYGSLALEPGYCDVEGTNATIDMGQGDADFFLVVPHLEGKEGGYGVDSDDDARPPANIACYPQTVFDDCAP